MKLPLSILTILLSLGAQCQSAKFDFNNRLHLNDSLANDSVFLSVDNTAYPLKGMNDFYSSVMLYIKNNYPSEAKENGIKGMVLIWYIVDENGRIAEVGVQKGVNPIIDEVAKVAVSKYEGEWAPGYIHDTPVKQRMVLPVKFSL